MDKPWWNIEAGDLVTVCFLDGSEFKGYVRSKPQDTGDVWIVENARFAHHIQTFASITKENRTE